MATLAQEIIAATDMNFVGRVEMAILAAAQAISTEPTNTVNHPNRVGLMRQVANNPNQSAFAFAAMLAAQGLSNLSTDAQINSMVSAVWNTLAGVP